MIHPIIITSGGVVKNPNDPFIATGAYLDNISSLFGYVRYYRETDASFRNRILTGISWQPKF